MEIEENFALFIRKTARGPEEKTNYSILVGPVSP